MMILGDWGTSRLRLFLWDGDKILDRADAPGIGALNAPPLATLRDAIAPWLAQHGPLHITLCGMVGSRNGLIEVPYTPCPVDSKDWAARAFDLTADGLSIRIAPGLACNSPAGAPDVMRGEETQIFGALAQSTHTQGRQLIILPGTHSKWALVENSVITAFHTFPTGELFALLRDHSTLTRAGDGDDDRDTGFRVGLERAGGKIGLLARLFEARSAQLIEGRSRGWALGLLSGLLIGRELADGLELFGLISNEIAMIGDPTLTTLYRQAFAARGMKAHDLDGNNCAIAGLRLLVEGVAT